MQTHTDTHYTEQSVKCSGEEMMIRQCLQCRHTGAGFTWKKEKGALDVVPSVKINHGGVSLAAPPPGPGYLRQTEETHSRGKMA